jgi:Glycosyltransferase WbsX/Methyltransferase domain
MEPLRHYVESGWKEGRSPHPLFDPKSYLERNPDVQAAGMEPLGHYIESGWKEGRSPHPLFDPESYLERNPAVAASSIEPLQHYRTIGWREGCDPHPLFSTRWYLENNPDISALGINPLEHYCLRGWKEGRDPNPLFNSRWYLENNPDIVSLGLDPLRHYCERGWKEHCDPHPDFSIKLYYCLNPDLTLAPVEPLAHYLASISDSQPQITPPSLPELSREPHEASDSTESDVQLIAFYLPQFHQIPENDAWWGNGFTEWTNVRRARQQYPGHYQPHIPHPSLGYYDLTDESILERQATMAIRFGIHGFCFYHYWFGGKRLLEMPVERMLSTGRPDIPFCLCWANENWTRRWDGHDAQVLISQSHSAEDDKLFILDLLRAFRDRRYIRIQGQPLLLVYKPELLPDPPATFQLWRHICRSEGIGEIFIAGVRSFNFVDRSLGFDALVDFPPHGAFSKILDNRSFAAFPEFNGNLHDYLDAFHSAVTTPRQPDILYFQGIMPSWDNTARRQENSHIFINSKPEYYYLWLRHLIRQTRANAPKGKRLVFINAWNEWAEGCHLEPDERNGFAWLNATQKALCSDKTKPGSDDDLPKSEFFLSNKGRCPICEKPTTFTSRHEWLRDHYLCELCHSIPRERALMHVIQRHFPDWRNMCIHESSPVNRGTSAKLGRECRNYVASQYDPALGFGKIHPTRHYRSEDLERQTFPDQCFNLVITQDVFEHIFDADAAFCEIARTLKPGGAHVFTVPLVNKERPTQRRASRGSDGAILYHGAPEYHGNPVSAHGSLVTWHWGFDIVNRIQKVSGMRSHIIALDDLHLGIRAEYNEVMVSEV